jgi:two-component system cell cycle sensor histidine kinase/response regulator CckA
MAYCPETGDWRHILNTIQDMVMVLDLQQQVLWANRSFLTFLGLPEEEVIGRPCHRLVHAGTGPGDECPCARMVKSGQRESTDMDLPDRDMRLRITADPLRDGDGNLAGSIHILSDVTATRRAELHAQCESRRLTLLTRIATSLLGDFDIEAMLTETARDLARFLGVPRCVIFLSGSIGGTVEYHEPDSPSAIDFFRELSNAAASREAFESGSSLAITDIRLWPYPDGKEGPGTILPRAFIGVPFCDREKLFGVLFLDRPEPHEWTENEIETAEAVARQVALAVRQGLVLREQQQLAGKLLSLMNNVPGVVYRGLRDWSLTFVGAEVERLTGYTAEEFLQGSTRWWEIVHPDDLPSVKITFRNAVRERKKVLRVEYRIRHRDGGYRWFADRRQLLYGPDGSFDHVDGLLLDISEPKRVEEDLRQSEYFLYKSQQVAFIGSYSFDIRKKTWTSSATLDEIFGIDDTYPKDVPGWVARVVPEQQEEILVHLNNHVVTGRNRFEKEYQILRFRDGEKRWVCDVGELQFDENGNPTMLIGTVHDITERKDVKEQTENLHSQLLQAQKMEAVGRLAGGVAHDFNNLLTAIRGYSDLLLHRLDACSPYRKEVEEIHKAGERASTLTQQLLAFSRKQVIQPKVMDLNEVVAGMEEMIGRMIGENIDLITVLRPDLWSVKVDKSQIEQVVMNLVVNARDAIEGRGKITVETGNVYLDDEYVSLRSVVTPGAYVMLAVSDTGVGMDDETKARLFEPFFTTKEKGKGTGLGLSTVYGSVKQSDGYIWVYSEPNQGSVFKIYFPRHESLSGGEDPERMTAAPPRGHETILLVEDEVLVRVLVRDVLTEHGYRVLEAKDGAEAMGIAVSHRGPIHLMIADVVMPNMGGPEVAVSLAPLMRDMRVLFMSGYTDEAIAQRGILRPGTCFLQKPFRLDALLRKVREVLDA